MLRPVANADVLITMVVAAGEAQDRMRAQNSATLKGREVSPPWRGGPGFTAMTQEQRQDAARKGGSANNAKDRYGLTDAEFQEFGKLLVRGFKSEEAAGVLIRSRRASAPNPPPGAP